MAYIQPFPFVIYLEGMGWRELMTETKSEADQRILSQAKVDDNDVSKINIRHTDSTHPVDCSCDPCKELRFTLNSNMESIEKDRKGLYNNHKPVEP